MANFEIAFKRREPIEGGWSNEPEDDGNWRSGKQQPLEKPFNEMTNADFNKIGLVGTNRGVTAAEYSLLLGHPASIEEMKAMPREHAIAIFKPKYWDRFRGDEINDQGIANNLYDACINQGLITGIKEIQQAASLPIIGKMDDFTLNRLNNKA